MGNKFSKVKSRKSRYGVVGATDAIDDESDYNSDNIIVGSGDSPDSPIVPEHVLKFRTQLSIGPVCEMDRLAAAVADTRKYIYPFENLVFEGGGSKGLAYCGAVKEMEEMGIMGQVTRFSGTSAGAMTATLLCVGFSADEIRGFLSQDLRKVFLDHSCGYLSLLPNLLRSYGWNPGKKIFRWFGDRLFEATQNRNITFREVYELFGKELCVVVTNLSQMSTTYCHVKTTPDLPVGLAVRMSLAIPGMFSAMKYTSSGHTDIFVDGGVLCNYPIHTYDGWWLSMDPDDSFLRKLQPLSQLTELCQKKNRFGTWNQKTLGFLLYADNESEMYRSALEARQGAELPEFPDTQLAREYKQTSLKMEKASRQSRKVLTAVDRFLKVLNDHDVDRTSSISLAELEQAFNDPSFTSTDRKILFGESATAEGAFEAIRHGKREEINYPDIMRFLEANGINMHARIVGLRRRNVKNFSGFLDSLQTCLTTNVKRVYMEERDIDRTVGINTGYLGTTDFFLQEEDRDFLVEQGRRSFVTFLRYYVAENNPPMKSANEIIAEETATNHSNEPTENDLDNKQPKTHAQTTEPETEN